MNIFGKLGLDAIPHDPIVQVTGCLIALGAVGLLALITYFKKWTWFGKNGLQLLITKKLA